MIECTDNFKVINFEFITSIISMNFNAVEKKVMTLFLVQEHLLVVN